MPDPTPASLDEALKALSSLSNGQLDLDRLDKVYDTLKLIGVVLGYFSLLRLATDPSSDPRARVSAARALMATRESPESIAERLRRSAFAGLTVQELERIVQQSKTGQDVDELMKKLSTHTQE